MLAQRNKFGDDVFSLPGYIMQEKVDGTRILAVKREGDDHIYLMPRSWKEDYSDRYPEIIADLERIPSDSFVIDGEIAFVDPDTKKCLFYSVRTLRETTEREHLIPRFLVFDILEESGENLRDYDLLNRMYFLDSAIPSGLQYIGHVETYTDQNEFESIYDSIIACGGEGVVMKNIDSPYKENGRTKDWIKVKRSDTGDFFICGITKGTGAREHVFGALILGQYDSAGNVNTVKCGTGLTVEQVEWFYGMIMGMPSVKPYFDTRGLKVIRAVPPEVVVECKYMEATKGGSYRLPVFLRIRDDKLPEQCVVQ